MTYSMATAYAAGQASRDAEVEALQAERDRNLLSITDGNNIINRLHAEVEALKAEVNKWHRGAIGLAMGRPFEGPSIYPDAARKEK